MSARSRRAKSILERLIQTRILFLGTHEKALEVRSRITELEQLDKTAYNLVVIEYQGNVFSGKRAYGHRKSGNLFCPVCVGRSRLTPIQFSGVGNSILWCGWCDNRMGKADPSRDLIPPAFVG